MASIYDDMIGKAAEDILASAEVDKPKQYVWIVEPDDLNAEMVAFHTLEDAEGYALSDTSFRCAIYRLEVL